MAPIDKGNWQVRLSVVAIFLLGALAGALAMNIYRDARSAPPPRPGRWGGGLERVFDGLNLTPEQKSQVDQILSDSRKRLMDVRKQSAPQYEEIRKQTNDKLKSVLTPAQWQQFQEQLSQHRPHRRTDREGPPPDGPPPLIQPSSGSEPSPEQFR